jgi:dienelactone hydrolase
MVPRNENYFFRIDFVHWLCRSTPQPVGIFLDYFPNLKHGRQRPTESLEAFSMRRPFCLFGLLSFLFTFYCAANTARAPRFVDLTATDGTKLKATYFSAAAPGPGVLLLHQCNRQRKVWDDLAARLAAAGVNVLTLDYRGYGESAGTRVVDLNPEQMREFVEQKLPADIDVAFEYLLAQSGVSRNAIGVGGASCGVNQSIQAARRHPEIISLVLLSGASDPAGRQFLRNSANLPIFFAAAGDDGGGSAVELMQWLFSISPNAGNHFELYGVGGHGVEMFEAHKELPNQIVDRFVTTLIKTPGKAPATTSKTAAAKVPSILAQLEQSGGVVKVTQMLLEARQLNPNAQLFFEDNVNYMGYERLQAHDAKGAVEILNLNVIAYPNSPNAYDSLSDAYLADGQKELARRSAKKALELLAADTNDSDGRRKLIKDSAEEKLKQLGSNPQ